MPRSAVGFLAALVGGLAFACGGEAPAPASGAAAAPASAAVKARWKMPDGTVQLELERKDDRYRVRDGADAPIGEVRLKDDRVTFKDANDVETLKIKRKDDGAEIEDAAGNRLYRIKRDDDGSMRLRDAADEMVLRLRLKDDGFEVRDAQGTTLAKAKNRDGQVDFKTEEGTDIGHLDGIESARAAMWLAAEPLSLEQRAALVVYYLEIER